jgi:hypothetical protein
MKNKITAFALVAGVIALGACSDLAQDPFGPQSELQDVLYSDLITAQGNCVDNGDGTGASGASGKHELGWDDGDPFLTFSAPAGYLIYMYCVKAGAEASGGGAMIIDVDPPLATVVIDHPNVNSVSHFVAYFVQGETPDGEWCSPGFWRNNPLRVAQTGVDMSATFSSVFGWTPDRSPQGIRSGAPTNPTLQQVLNNPNWYGGGAFNMVGDHLSENHPDVDYQGERVEGSCPLSADASGWYNK